MREERLLGRIFLTFLEPFSVFSTNTNITHYDLMTNGDSAMVQILETPTTSITSTVSTSLALSLNNLLDYGIGFMDPTFAVISGNPETVPRTFAGIPHNSGHVHIYIKVKTSYGRPPIKKI